MRFTRIPVRWGEGAVRKVYNLLKEYKAQGYSHTSEGNTEVLQSPDGNHLVYIVTEFPK